MNQIKNSHLLETFFNQYSSLSWFNEFLPWLKADLKWENGEETWGSNLIELGFSLALKAKKQPVCEVYIEEEDVNLYFIGQEKTILKRVERDLKLWLQKNPQKSREENILKELQDRKRQVQAELEEIKQKETKLLTQNKVSQH